MEDGDGLAEYVDLYDRYGEEFAEDERRLVGRVRALIEATVSDLQLQSERLRPDARLFLLVNYYELLVRPLRLRTSPMDEEEIFSRLRSDATHTLAKAAETTGEISGHLVMSTVNTEWHELQLGAEARVVSERRIWRR